jgi:glyoxylase-like metal-dependent hydrolase (beta-lactamase superfamily II)
MIEDLELVRFELGPFGENAYVLVGPSKRRAAIFDPGFEVEKVLRFLKRRGLTLDLVVNTHGHLDHIAGNRLVKDMTGAPIAIHPADSPYLRGLPVQGTAFGYDVEPSPEPDLALEDGVPLPFDGIEIDVIHTPGHTPGGTCLKFGRRMIVGDTLFQGSVGRTDLPGGSWPDLLASIRGKLFRLPADTVCYPGHGPETTLGHERLTNPFVSDEAVGERAEGRP